MHSEQRREEKDQKKKTIDLCVCSEPKKTGFSSQLCVCREIDVLNWIN